MLMNVNLRKIESFQEELKYELNTFLKDQKSAYPDDELLKIDLHCHDHNSDVPDELLGRILNVPETWLKTEKLLETLKRNKVDAFTITNHNNARSCFELKRNGVDVLTGAEFSCFVPDFEVGIHVLAYGFDEEQEKILNKLRNNVYNFQRFALSNDIPTIWAHPLYHYKTNGIPPMDFFNKMGLIFERFEVLNGQRDTWQNLLAKFWIDALTPEKIDTYSDKYDINPRLYCRNPYKKSFSGGSDSHMGIFTGQTGTYLHVPDLQKKLFLNKPSELALSALKLGNMIPYGNHQNYEKLTIAFLEYFCQIALYKKDPGLMRILLHKGTAYDKMIALIISNAFTELQQHKVTMRFVELFHNCFNGIVPSKSKRIFTPKVYKPVFDDARQLASNIDQLPGDMAKLMNDNINSISNKLNTILYGRLIQKVNNISPIETSDLNLNEIIEKLEIPSDFRALFNKKENSENRMTQPNIGAFLDGLSFPFLASSIILAANFTSTKVMYNNRELLNSFSKNINKLNHPERLLWLTDTFDDKNGVSMFLQDVHKEIKRRNLPIDLLVCSSKIKSDDHLIVVPPMAEFKIPYYENQVIRIPNFIEIHNLFLENEYDRIICSTEGIMGLVSLYLKTAYSVKAYFYMHTDWLMFARKVLNLDTHNLNRVRRFLRAYYNAFDGLFVLNSDHRKWLTSNEMGFKEENVFQTAHWVDKKFKPLTPAKKEVFGLKENNRVLLFAGRISHEKGVMDVVKVYKELRSEISDLKLVFAGTGPAEKDLKKEIPDALFMGWVDHNNLPLIYSSADLLILPSKFDTFSCVVLEAMSCGLPVVAYRSKGPKDIIQHLKNGYLASNKNEMIYRITEFFNNEKIQKSFKEKAIERAQFYHPDKILESFLHNIELISEYHYEKIEA